jgi:glc operon protein GlcG
MRTRTVLERSDAQTMLDAAVNEAVNKKWAVSIAVVDEGGHLLAFSRLDGCPAVSATIAVEKARTSVLGKRESKVYEDIVNNGRTAFLSVVPLQGMLEGGVPVFVNGDCVGAVGVSGVKSVEDAQVARAGIAALKLS